ncbi:MAG: FAD:protein FMN transferase [Acidimicrobiales bacterium]
MSGAWHRRVEAMGTILTLDLFGEGLDAVVDDLAARAAATLREIDRVFSTYRDQSPLSRLRRGAATLAEMPPEVPGVLDACREAHRLSGGWFDPWRLPGGVDPTGYVKGWAAGRALEDLRHPLVTGAIVNAAGDLASFGDLDGEPFRIGIGAPQDPGALAGVVLLAGALATSGTAQQSGHLMDPFAGTTTARVASASVAGPDPGLCDALATALAVGGNDVLERLEALEGYAGLVIDADGRWRATPGFPWAEPPPASLSR